MVRYLVNRFRRPTVKSGSLLFADISRTQTRNAQFVSFLSESGFRKVDPGKYERSLRRRRVVAHVLLWSILAGFGWVVIESAQALSLF
ncbi:MAG: hypothetical protein R3F07_20090 [Opitutaceae bacterium]